MATQEAPSKSGDSFQISSTNPTFDYNGAGSTRQVDPADPLSGLSTKQTYPPGPADTPTLLPPEAPTVPDDDCGCSGGSATTASGGITPGGEIPPGPIAGEQLPISASEGALSRGSSPVLNTSDLISPAAALPFLRDGAVLLLLLALLFLANSRRR